MASRSSLVWLLFTLLAVVAAQLSEVTEVTTDVTMLPEGEQLPKLPNGCFTPETHPDCYSSADVTASVLGTFILTLAFVLIIYVVHRLCWRVYNTKLANYAI